jgi:hypothetical protein
MRKCFTLVKSTEKRSKNRESPELEAFLDSGPSLFRFYFATRKKCSSNTKNTQFEGYA